MLVGESLFFRGWPEALPGVEIWMAQLPGRGSGFDEAAYTSMLPLVQALARQLRASSDERPFAFFGHSLGARLSFELARSLRRQGKPLPAHLFVSACAAPQIPRERSLHTLPRTAFLAELERFNGIPKAVLAEQELLDLMLPVLRADFTVYETAVYNSEPSLSLPHQRLWRRGRSTGEPRGIVPPGATKLPAPLRSHFSTAIISSCARPKRSCCGLLRYRWLLTIQQRCILGRLVFHCKITLRTLM